jgi:hypothetical protein
VEIGIPQSCLPHGTSIGQRYDGRGMGTSRTAHSVSQSRSCCGQATQWKVLPKDFPPPRRSCSTNTRSRCDLSSCAFSPMPVIKDRAWLVPLNAPSAGSSRSSIAVSCTAVRNDGTRIALAILVSRGAPTVVISDLGTKLTRCSPNNRTFLPLGQITRIN